MHPLLRRRLTRDCAISKDIHGSLTVRERNVTALIDCFASYSCFHTDRDTRQNKTFDLARTLYARCGITFKLIHISDAYQRRRGSWGNRTLYRVSYLAGFIWVWREERGKRWAKKTEGKGGEKKGKEKVNVVLVLPRRWPPNIWVLWTSANSEAHCSEIYTNLYIGYPWKKTSHGLFC